MDATRLTARALGVVIAAVAAWGGAVAYVGPTFDFDLGTTTRAWVWNQSHTTLHLAPGICGVVGGLLLIVGGRRLARVGAVLGIASGAWFLIGPTLQPLWNANVDSSATVGSAGSTTTRVLEGVGYHHGTGLVLVLASALALGLLARSRRVAPEPTPVVVREPDAEETIETATHPQLTYRRHPSHA